MCIATSGGLNQQRTGVKFLLIQIDVIIWQVDCVPLLYRNFSLNKEGSSALVDKI